MTQARSAARGSAETIKLGIGGMTCSACASMISDILRKDTGILGAR